MVKQHQGYGCPECTPKGCPAEERAGLVVFDAIAANLEPGPKSIDDVRRIVDETRGEPGD